MNDHEFAALSCIPLSPGSICPLPLEPPDFVRFEDPAIRVMTDFKTAVTVTTTADASVDDALEHMKTAGVRMLLVTDTGHSITGLITARDIMGERPIKVAQELRIPHAEITVGQIMTPHEAIVALTLVTVDNACVGHIVETLNQLERQHILVVEDDEETGLHRLRGMFSLSQIGKQLHRDVTHHLGAAHSLAEIVHEIK